MASIAVKLPDALLKRLEAEADARGTTRSALVRAALEALLSGGAARGSALAAARRWVGAIDAPADLSTNAKHMRSYGK